MARVIRSSCTLAFCGPARDGRASPRTDNPLSPVNNPGMPTEPIALAPADLTKLAQSLIASWRRGTHLTLLRSDHDIARAGTTHGLAAHVHRLAEVALDLLNRGLIIEAMPLVRSCYESALTAHWLVQVPGAPVALANEHVRNRRNLIKTLAGSSPFLQSLGARFQEDEPLPEEGPVPTVSARRFDELCNDLTPGGADAYAHYRLMSSMVHPTVFLIDFYTREDADPANVTGFKLSLDAEQPSPVPYLAFVVASLIWAGRAVDYLDKTKARRSELRAAARKIGITSELHPSPSALGFGAR
jgi:hypothetical protein